MIFEMDDDGSDLAIISGSGDLPLIIKNFYPKAICITFTDSSTVVEKKFINCEFEKLGFLFDKLKQNGIERDICYTGPDTFAEVMIQQLLRLFLTVSIWNMKAFTLKILAKIYNKSME